MSCIVASTEFGYPNSLVRASPKTHDMLIQICYYYNRGDKDE